MKLHVPVLLPVSKMVEVLLLLVLIIYMEIILYDAVSSTNSLARVVSFSGRSFMYARDKQGPSTVHWGTPDLMLTKED